jgi:hypothetical protein
MQDIRFYPFVQEQRSLPNGIVNLPSSGISGILHCMNTLTSAPRFKGYRFPSEMISHAVWLYFRFSLSFRDVEERTTHSEELSSPMKQSENGASRLDKPLPMNGVVAVLTAATNGIWMRYFSRSAERGTIYGEQWIRMATCWIS